MEKQESSQPLRPILPTKDSVGAGDNSDREVSPVSRPPKRRAPVTTVACQGCRKRKTKCNGGRPQCTNCARRGFSVCEYDAEGTQSTKIGIYKAKIEQQEMRILELETENRLLKQECVEHRRNSSPSRLPVQPLAMTSIYPLLAPISSTSSTLSASSSSTALTQNKSPEHELHFHPNSRSLTSGQLSQSGMVVNRGGLQHESANDYPRLESENQQLRELVPLLTSLEDKSKATDLALRIRDHGVDDHVLSDINRLVVAGSSMPLEHCHPLAPSRTAPSLPTLSSLDLLGTPFGPAIPRMGPASRTRERPG